MTPLESSLKVARNRANLLCGTINYIAVDANIEFNETHGSSWIKIRIKTIPCLITLLDHLANQLSHDIMNKAKIEEVKSIITTFERLKDSDPTMKCEVTAPLDLAIRLKVN